MEIMTNYDYRIMKYPVVAFTILRLKEGGEVFFIPVPQTMTWFGDLVCRHDNPQILQANPVSCVPAPPGSQEVFLANVDGEIIVSLGFEFPGSHYPSWDVEAERYLEEMKTEEEKTIAQ